ncbi:MAG: hypothetical protein KGI82_09735 [Betaproteobacteria bacterium]|nr:hypothetical protein [Betaproteobacteria bacterium]
MSQTTFNVGRDVSAVAITATGQRLDLTGLTKFTVKDNIEKVKRDRVNTVPLMRALPDGHDITFDIDRMNGTNDAFISSVEQGYWAGGYPNGTTGGGTLYVYINETDGSTSTYLGTNAVFWMEDRLSAEQKSAVTQTMMGFCSTYQKV